jgi:hypothetical protein
VRNAVSGLGLAPDAAMVTFPIALFLPGSDIGPVEARRQASGATACPRGPRRDRISAKDTNS